MSHGLYIPAEDGEGVYLPSRFRWPCGDLPYRRTVRAAFYRARYAWSRLALWLVVVIPPLVYVRLQAPFEIWSLPQRLVVDAAVLAGACCFAWAFDVRLFGSIFDGEPDNPDAPCLANADRFGYEWRRQWAGFEATMADGHDRHFGGSVRFMLPVYGVDTFDLSPLVQGLGLQDFLTAATYSSKVLIDLNPGSIGRALMYNWRPGVLILTPIAWAGQPPETATTHVWLVLSEPTTANPGAVQTTGISYWFPGGRIADGRTGRSDAEVTSRQTRLFRDATLDRPLLCTLLLWPFGMLWLCYEAWREERHGERYQEFAVRYSPALGDSLDLWLVQRARAHAPRSFTGMPDDFHRRSQAVGEQFKAVFAAIGKMTAGGARGGVR